jgi:NADH dehydrogenase (ubiquinone) 1 beta subcomplex subunit 9
MTKSWINRRDLFRQKALEIRQQFDENKNIANRHEAEKLIRSTQQLLNQYKHPDPIIPSQRPGGTKFERNVPPPQGKSKFFSYP